MKTIEKRLAGLEARRSLSSLDHLTDDELRERTVECYRTLARCGLALPDEWESDFRADPVGFHRRMEPSLSELAALI